MDKKLMEITERVEGMIRKAGTRDPLMVADKNGYAVATCSGSVIGMSTHFKTIPGISINERLKSPYWEFAGYHEIWHVENKDIYDEPSGFHHDLDMFDHDVDSKVISTQERKANLFAAHMIVADKDVLALLNYDSLTLQNYRELKSDLASLVESFNRMRFSTNTSTTLVKVRMQELKQRINETSNALHELEYALSEMDFCKTQSELARELGISVQILGYKLEAMRLLGYDIDRQKLERYDKMFKDVI